MVTSETRAADPEGESVGQPSHEREESVETRERRLRRALARHGMRLEKVPARSWLRREYGVGYRVMDDRNNVAYGYWGRHYQATLDEVEEWVAALGD